MKKIKRNITRYTTLLLIPAMALLIGCGNDAQVDSSEIMESTEMMENVEANGESIKSDEVDITSDEAETQEEKTYELFLNGELTVELEEEQVTIDELFWNNDIEYCFEDIDGDGIGNYISEMMWYIMR